MTRDDQQRHARDQHSPEEPGRTPAHRMAAMRPVTEPIDSTQAPNQKNRNQKERAQRVESHASAADRRPRQRKRLAAVPQQTAQSTDQTHTRSAAMEIADIRSPPSSDRRSRIPSRPLKATTATASKMRMRNTSAPFVRDCNSGRLRLCHNPLNHTRLLHSLLAGVARASCPCFMGGTPMPRGARTHHKKTAERRPLFSIMVERRRFELLAPTLRT